MRNFFRSRLFVILSFFLILLGIPVSVYLVSHRTNLFGRAQPSTVPQGIKITNISDNSFTVSWITSEAATGFVTFGETETLGKTALDDRDKGAPVSRQTHHVTLKNLQSTKEYFFKINSAETVYDDQGKSFKQLTAPTTANPPAVPEPIFGKVSKKDNSIPTEALVYLEIVGGSPLSSYTRDDGNWLITLNNARTKDLSDYITFGDSDMINLLVDGGLEGTAQIQAKMGEKDAFSKIVLAKKTLYERITDLNGDGVINVFDYILYLKQKI